MCLIKRQLAVPAAPAILGPRRMFDRCTYSQNWKQEQGMNIGNSGSSPHRQSTSVIPIPRSILLFPGPSRPEDEGLAAASRSDGGGYPPVIVVFSPAGGTGKTGLVANLGRALALQGEDVFLIDTSLQESLIHYFGAAHAYAGDIQTVYDRKTGTRIRLAQLPIACHGPGGDGEDWLRDEMAAVAMSCDRIVIDLSTASRWLTWRIFRMSPLLLIPMLPDWNAVLSLPAIERFLDLAADSDHLPIEPNFLLNQFNPQLPFHRTVLEELRSRVGERLLSMILHRSLDVDEALAQGKTVLEFEPDAQLSRDYLALAGWILNRSCVTGAAYACASANEAS
jgi:cellulose biosynthesis protein BcsQ